MNEIKKKIMSAKYWIYLLVIVVFGLLLFLYSQEKRIDKEVAIKVQFIEEKNALREDLNDLIDEHNDLLDQYGNLNSQLAQQDSVIQQQIKEIRELIRTKEDLKAARNKIEQLKAIAKRYLAEIDSLYIITSQLHHEKDSVIEVNKTINWKNLNLSKANEELTEKVSKGSVLKIGNILVEAMKERSSGKEVMTTKAKKVINLRISFAIEENAIAEKGVKDLLIRILSPNGEVLTNTNKKLSFTFKDNNLNYSVLKQVQYDNQLLPVNIEFRRRDPLTEGVYEVEVYLDNQKAGSQKFALE